MFASFADAHHSYVAIANQMLTGSPDIDAVKRRIQFDHTRRLRGGSRASWVVSVSASAVVADPGVYVSSAPFCRCLLI